MNEINYEKLDELRDKVYLELKEKLKENNRVAMVEYTGFGKTKIAIRLCEEFQGKKIIVEPSRPLADRIQNIVKDMDTEVIIYHSLLYYSDASLIEKFKDVKFLILDELHRSGAEEWNKRIQIILDNYPEIKLIGMTATPERTDGRNMVEELFNGSQVCSISLLDAIDMNIAPRIKYITAFSTLDDTIRNKEEILKDSYSKYKEKYKEVLDLLKHKMSAVYNIPSIFKRNIDYNLYLDNKNFKIVMFVSRLHMLDEASDNMIKWLKEAYPEKVIKTYLAKSNISRKDTTNMINEFENNEDIDTIDVLISVDKLGEGFHISGVDCAIFYRKTISKIKFTQQLGRIMNSENPIVFDLVGNYENIDKDIISRYDELKKYKTRDWDRRFTIPPIYMIDETKEIREILDSLRKETYHVSKEVIDYIKSNPNKTIKELSAGLGIDKLIVRGICRRYKLDYKNECKAFSREEIEYIKSNVNKVTIEEMENYLGRSKKSIKAFCRNNGIKLINENYNFVSQEVIDYIKANSDKTIKELSDKLNIKQDNVRAICKRYNLKVNIRDASFTDKEVEFIKSNTNMTASEIANCLGRTSISISSYCRYNNIKIRQKFTNWTKEEINILLENKDKGVSYVSRLLPNRTISAIRTYCLANNIDLNKRAMRKFSEKEINFIKSNCKNMTVKEMADRLDRSEVSLRGYLLSNGMKYKSGYNKKFLSDKQIKIINSNLDKNFEELIKLTGINCSMNTFSKLLKENGIVTKYSK